MGINGNYDPYAPSISGLPWVPIVPGDYTPDQSLERGYSFIISGVNNNTLNQGRFVVKDLPTGVIYDQVPFMNLYRAGDESAIGQIRKYVIPVSDTGSSLTGNATISPGSATIAQALSSPSDDASIVITSPTSSTTSTGNLHIRFNTSTVTGLLTFSRILNVSILYTASGDWAGAAADPGSATYTAVVRGGAANFGTVSETTYYGSGVLTASDNFFGVSNSQINRISLGEISPFWSASSPQNTRQRYPWREDSLARFDESIVGTTSLGFHLGWTLGTSFTPTESLQLQYLALEITACEENRIFYGGVSKGGGFNTEATDTLIETPDYTDYLNTPNIIVMRSTFSLATGGVVEPGTYTVTIHNADIGDELQVGSDILLQDVQTRPRIAANRELYQIPTLPGLEVVRPLKLGDVCETRSSPIIPAIGITDDINPPLWYSSNTGYVLPTPVRVNASLSLGQTIAANDTTTEMAYLRAYVRAASGAPPISALVVRVVSDVTVPLNTTTVYATGSILYPEFAVLPEIADGWREVTFTLNPRPLLVNSVSFGVRFDSGTPTGNDWEVLLADEQSAESVPGGGANYGAIFYNAYSGQSNIAMTVMSRADVPAIFSPAAWPVPIMAGFTQSLAVTGVGLNCATPASCIPTGVGYNRLLWSGPPNTYSSNYDEFERTSSSSWGTTPSGVSWTNSGGAASDYFVNGRGNHTILTGTGTRMSSLPSGGRNQCVRVLTTTSPGATGTGDATSVLLRSNGTSTFYRMSAERSGTNSRVDAVIYRVVAGVSTTLSIATEVVDSASADMPLWIYAEVEERTLRLKVWPDAVPEPDVWSTVILDTSGSAITGSGMVALESRVFSASNPRFRFTYDHFRVSAPISTFGAYEIQRQDAVDPTWQTIAVITDPGNTTLSDYEARVGVQSTYRMRNINVLNFLGDWSNLVNLTVAAPGGTGDGTLGSLLFFTTNDMQSGVLTYAAPEVGDSPPDFEPQFREAGQVTYQDLFDRDYPTSYHVTERGGLSFTTALLENNGVINPAALNKSFVRFRDLAWEAVPYVCVRTSDGDRWYANVRVTDGNIRRRTNTTSIARATITEVAAVPYPVDPSWPFSR